MTHVSVLREAAVQALIGNPSGTYIDGTFGRGGHARAILQQLSPQGRLLAIDKDTEAVAAAAELAADARFAMQQGSFAQLVEFAQQRQWLGKVDGILLDLGVSSPQLDQAERGFSFNQDGPLDMRMDTSSGETAAQWLARAGEAEIADVLWQYGEERFSRRMARAIVAARATQAITRTAQLADIVAAANPRWEKHKHPATRAFQAIRIQVNAEIDDVSAALQAALEVLAVGGRLVVISFHSLEDRLVKQFMRREAKGEPVPASVPIRDSDIKRRLKLCGKAIKPGAAEINANPRARSAVMRVAEKLH